MVLGFLRRKKYVLRARINKQWEEISEYDKKVTITEIKPTIDELFESGYDYVALYECDSNLKRCRNVWSKRKGQKPLGDLEYAVETLKRFRQLANEITPSQSVDDLIAQFIYMDNLFKALANRLRPYMSNGSGDFVDRMMEVVLTAIASRLGANVPLPTHNNPNMQTTNNVASSSNVEDVEPPPKEISLEPPDEAREVAKQIIEDAERSFNKEIAPCMEGASAKECIEGGK